MSGVSFHKTFVDLRATNQRAFWRKGTYKDNTLYASVPVLRLLYAPAIFYTCTHAYKHALEYRERVCKRGRLRERERERERESEREKKKMEEGKAHTHTVDRHTDKY